MLKKEVYKDYDADKKVLENKIVSVIGYGIQGRAQALNLRDSGLNTIIGNIEDEYYEKAQQDGFSVYSIKEAIKLSDVTLFLIPDGSHKNYIDKILFNLFKENSLLIFAHGYSLRFESLNLPKNIDIAMLAPRYPGKQIRESYLNGSGVPAFIDVFQDHTDQALLKLVTIGGHIGFGKAGMIPISYSQEAEIDLFIEQFMAPVFYASIENAMDLLSEKGYPKILSCLELYYSGEVGAVRTQMGRYGLYEGLKMSASPTCKFGIANSVDKVFSKEFRTFMESQLENIRSGQFAKKLNEEEKLGYPKVKEFFNKRENNIIIKSEKQIDQIINKPKI
tara:strand:+ start:2528 stop:3529 length:1002 start_codon:yes stop_codon:yes gene_type:complete